MSLVLNGTSQCAYRDNADVANLLVVGSELRMSVRLDSTPGEGAFYDLFTFDRDESNAQMLAFRVTETRQLRVQFVTSSQTDTDQNKDTTATLPLDTWTDVALKIVSNNGSNNYTIAVTIGETTENLSPTGTGAYRADLCSFFSIGAAITSSAVFHSFFDGKIADVEIYNSSEVLIHDWSLLDDAEDGTGDLDLTLEDTPSFDTNDHPGAGTPVSQTVALRVEALGGVAGTRGALAESLARAEREFDASIEALARASRTSPSYQEALARASAASAARGEALAPATRTLGAYVEALARASGLSEILGEALGSATRASPAYLEALARASATSSPTTEALARVARALAARGEALARASATSPAVIEVVGLVLVARTIAALIEARGRAAATAPARTEALGCVTTGTLSSPALVLNGTTQAAIRANSDVTNLLATGNRITLDVRLDAAPAADTFGDIFTFDRKASVVQTIALRVLHSRQLRLQFMTSSATDTTANKDTTGTIPLGEWVTVELEVLQNVEGNTYDIAVSIDGNEETLTPTGTGPFRPDLCEFLSFGAASTSGDVLHSFLAGALRNVVVTNSSDTPINSWPFAGDGADTTGALDLTLVGAPDFEGEAAGSAVLVEALSRAVATSSPLIEALGAAAGEVSASADALIEVLARARASAGARTEALGHALASHASAIESLGYAASTAPARVEALGLILVERTIAALIEARGRVVVTAPTRIESLASATAARALTVEALAEASRAAPALIEALAIQLSPVSATSPARIEATAGVARTIAALMEARGFVVLQPTDQSIVFKSAGSPIVFSSQNPTITFRSSE